MKLKLLLLFFLLTQILSAQTFTEVPSASEFDGVRFSSIAFTDVDGDEDQDLLITGQNSSNERIAKLYTNDGQGRFSEILGTPFDGVERSSVAFADIDGDNDQDVLITGDNRTDDQIAKLYINDGQGNFSEISDTPFEGVSSSSIAFSDVDGDNDQDVLITGRNSSLDRITKLYLNDGQGNFSEMSATPFDGVADSSIAFVDVDGDNDPDVLITGGSSSTERIAKLYTNDGLGNFSEMLNTPFEGVALSTIAFADVDDDNDQDVLIMGRNNALQRSAKLYTNDGQGSFSEISGTPFEGVRLGSIAFADVDGDNDQDVFLTGENSFDEHLGKLYTNDGLGNFSEALNTPFDGIRRSSIFFTDLDGDTDQDLFITGENNSNERIAKGYLNDGLGNFFDLPGTTFDKVFGSSIAFIDVDGDNDQDVLITGENGSVQRIAKLYTNDGQGNFSEMTETPFDGVNAGSIAFADVNGDNDPDLLITGQNSSGQRIAKLYLNDGQGNFFQITNTPFVGVFNGSIAFADVDGDNDQDLLITGESGSFDLITKLYLNDGQGNFSEMTDSPFDGVKSSSIAFADVDGDNDQDVLITGEKIPLELISKLYLNDGQGNFSEATGTPFDGVDESSIAFADVDGDNDQDVLITGQNNSGEQISKLYSNDGVGNFSELMGTPFEGIFVGSIAFADIDEDDDQDVLITGQNNLGERTVNLYTNDGQGIFSELTGTPFDAAWFSSIAFADIDGDEDQDVLITGQNNLGKRITKLYTNDGMLTSTDQLIPDFNFEIKPYPNPTTSNHLKAGFIFKENGFITVKIYDLNGQLLIQQKEFGVVGPQTISIDLGGLLAGSYFIEMEHDNRKGVAKFMVH